jgi:large subunit ribosomal protein L21
MYAVIETGGKQYRVAVGDKVKVEKLAAAEGESVDLDRVLMIQDGSNVQVGTPTLESKVSAKVVSQGRGDKIRIFKMKRRKHYRKQAGHRQDYTELEITGIG